MKRTRFLKKIEEIKVYIESGKELDKNTGLPVPEFDLDLNLSAHQKFVSRMIRDNRGKKTTRLRRENRYKKIIDDSLIKERAKLKAERDIMEPLKYLYK